MSPLLAGLAYGALVYATAFALGLVRVLFLDQTLGPALASAWDLAVLLLGAWVSARILARRMRPPVWSRDLLLMGFVGYGVLIAVEFSLDVAAYGNTPEAELEAWWSMEGAGRIVGHLVFAVLPVWATRTFGLGRRRPQERGGDPGRPTGHPS